jgi:hypothetical protein
MTAVVQEMFDVRIKVLNHELITLSIMVELILVLLKLDDTDIWTHLFLKIQSSIGLTRLIINHTE